MTVSSRIRIGATASLLAGLVLALSGLSSAAPIVLDPEEPAERMALRLHDLPPGYLIFGLGSEGANDSFLCEDIVPSDPGKQLARWVDRFHPHGCVDGYYRSYRVPGPGPAPPLVGTGALETDSLAAAEGGLALSPLLLAKLVGDAGKPLVEVAPASVVGDGTRLFHWRGVPGYLEGGGLGTFVAWRSGTALGAVLATGSSFARTDSAALELARRQQAHIASPTPYTVAERDTVEVSLDNPESDFPVHWLGRTFRPGHGLTATELVETAGPYAPRPVPNPRTPQVRLRYADGPTLTLWGLPGWKRFTGSRLGRAITSKQCSTSQPLELARGRAVIVSTPFSPLSSCHRKRGAPYHFAYAFIGKTVIGVSLPGCEHCFLPGSEPYSSLKGIKAILRGLELRPKPVYRAAP
ncbi:MAG TPA: hypothetical protein VHR18_09665 [Solirubrobacterales bacterium]|jgi:hypothetical protein|nr:hypothetical protein [Solirubrobacterales bacterium]